MTDRVILLTIQEKYANQILGEEKPVEYRTRPPRITRPTRTIMYVSGTKELVGELVLEPAGGEKTIYGFPMPVSSPRAYKETIAWESVKEKIPGIRPAQQSFRYLNPENDQDAELIRLLESQQNQ